MIIDRTELEYTEADGICLDYYLGEHSETKEQWAKRVWDKCAEYKSTDGKGLDGKGMSSVYARSPQSIWEEKKRRRRARMVNECCGQDCCKDLLTPKKIDADLKKGCQCEWPETHSDTKILEIRDNPEFKYETATKRHQDYLAKKQLKAETYISSTKAKLAKLREKGFDDETIEILYPGKLRLEAL